MMHLNPNNYLIIGAFTIGLLISCTKKIEKTDYIAKVNESYLTESELAELVDTTGQKKLKEEAIRNWVQKELLFQKAAKEGIVKNNSFKSLVKTSEKELAGAILLQRFADSQNINVTESQLINYYDIHKSEFKLPFTAYYLNLIRFDDYDKAVQFRSFLLQNNWQTAVAQFQTDPSVNRVQNAVTINEQDLYPPKLARLVQLLQPLEISIVISDDSGYHTVVQVLNKFPVGSVPSFEAISSTVEARFRAEQLKKLINKYIDDLYSQNQVDIKY